MLVFGIALLITARGAEPPLPDYKEITAESYSAQLEPGHSLKIWGLCRFVNRKLQAWAPDGTVWNAQAHPELMKKVRDRMSAELEFVPKDPNVPFRDESKLFVFTEESGGFTANQTLVTEGFQPMGGGPGKIVASLYYPKIKRDKPFADISILATPDEIGMKLFSFNEKLEGLPPGIEIQELRVDKQSNSWWFYAMMTGLSPEVTRRWYGLRTDEGNMFESKFPGLGKVVSESRPDQKSLYACSQPVDNPERMFHLYVCRTWKLTFPKVRLRPLGWNGD